MSAITAKASRKMKKYAVLTREPRCFLGSFDFSWEQRKLGDVGETYTGLSGKTKADFGHGQARFITYMNVFSNPISNPEMTEPIEIDPKQNEVEVGDVFFTTSSETPEEVGMSSVLLEKRGKIYLNSFCFGFRPTEKIDSYYLAYMLRSESAREKIILLAQGISRYNISKNKVMEIAVSLPSLDEQKLIGQYFRQLDNLITLHQRKCANLCSPSQVVFSLLFATSTFSWEQRKFGEITSKYENPVPTPHDGYYRLGIRSHAKGTFHSYVAKGQELETAQMHRVAAGNFIVNITFGWEHAVAITDKNDAGKLVSHRFPQFSFAEGMVPEFFRYVIVDEKFRHHLWLASPGGAGRNRVLKLDEMLNYLMRFPSRDEQIKIAEFFRHLDNLITLHQRECISFTGRADRLILTANKKRTTSSWEQRKLGDVATFINGRAYSQPELLSSGKYKVLRVGNFYTNDSWYYSDLELGEKYYADYGDLLYTWSATFGPHIWLGDRVIYHYHIWKIDLSNQLEKQFAVQLLEQDKANILSSKNGSTMVHITKEGMEQKDVIIPPSTKEQQEIGAFFQQLDNLITLHQRKPFLMKWRNSDANRNQTNRLVL